MMNPESKEFEQIEQNLDELYQERPETRDWKKFHIGEQIEVKGESFYIRKITKKDIIIRPRS